MDQHASLPGLGRSQHAAITWLTTWCADHADVTSLSVGCSIGRGAADALSDVDAAVGVRAPTGVSGRDPIDRVERDLVASLDGPGDLVDVLRTGSSSHEFVIRRVFAQYADRLQLDLAVIAEPDVRRGDAAPDFVPVYQDLPGPPPGSPRTSAYDVSADQVHDWVFDGWRCLLDADKYLRRGSPWEAHQRLHQARDLVWRVWAAAQGTSYPQHGLSQVLDDVPGQLPPGIELTVAGLDLADLRRAVTAAGTVLRQVSAACAGRFGAEPPIGAYARTVLGRPAAVERGNGTGSSVA